MELTNYQTKLLDEYQNALRQHRKWILVVNPPGSGGNASSVIREVDYWENEVRRLNEALEKEGITDETHFEILNKIHNSIC
jgi:hypothetical protein